MYTDRGQPDLQLLREDKLMMIELKSEEGVLSPEQQKSISMLNELGIEVYVARPSDWEFLVELLT